MKISEHHEYLKVALGPLLEETKHLMDTKMVKVDGTSYNLEFFLGGDLKVVTITYIFLCE